MPPRPLTVSVCACVWCVCVCGVCVWSVCMCVCVCVQRSALLNCDSCRLVNVVLSCQVHTFNRQSLHSLSNLHLLQ